MNKGTRLPEIHLKRKAVLYQVEAIAEIRRRIEREELISLLRFGKEQIDDDKEFTPRSVIEEWLVGFPVSAGQRLLRRLEDLKLIQREEGDRGIEFLPSAETSYVLTEEGERAEQSNALFMPERLAMVIRYTNDPLIPDKIVSVQTHTERLKDLIVKGESNWNQVIEYDSIDLPDELNEIVGREIEVYEGNRAGRVIIDSFGHRVIPSQATSQINVDLRLSPQNQLALSISIASQTRDIVLSQDVEKHLGYGTVLPNLIRQTGQSWSNEKQAIRVSFSKVNDPQKKAFVMDVEIATPEVQHLGSFESCSLKEVPITPRTTRDAQRWFEYLIVEGITTYMTEPVYMQHVEKQRGPFTNLGYDLEAPSIQDLIDRFSNIQDDRTYHPVYWYLNTPRDLCIRKGD